jgi:hypothetical protein
MSEKEQSPMGQPGHFCWNELVVPDDAAAQRFYTQLLGWTTEPFGAGMDYTVLRKDGVGVGGLMKAPEPGIPAQWVPYVIVGDVDAAVAKAAQLGAKVCKAGFDIPEVGRIAVLADPQGAVFGIIKPSAR